MNCSEPVTASQLCELVHATAWVSTSIPRFSERVAPIRKVLEEAYKTSGSRKKKSISNVKVQKLWWASEQSRAFEDIRQQLITSTKLGRREQRKTLCFYADTSNEHWGALITQCMEGELSKKTQAQRHEPLAFVKISFTDREAHWKTFEREAYAVVQTFKPMDYLFACESDVRVITDHRNLLSTFNPLALEPTLEKHKILKVIR